MEPANQNNLNQRPPQQRPSRSKQFFFIIIIYLLFTMSGNFSISSPSFNRNTIDIMKNPDTQDLSVKAIMSIFTQQSYYGKWRLLDEGTPESLQKDQGRLTLKLYRFGSSINSEYSLDFQLNNGEYIDDGAVVFRTMIDSSKWQSSQNGTRFSISPKLTDQNNQTVKVQALYRSEKILRTLEQKIIQVGSIQLVVEYEPERDTVSVILNVQSQKISASLQVIGQQSNNFGNIIFAVVIFTISFTEFSAIMNMLRAIFEGQQSANNYSILTILVATMWDTTLCIISFIEAFGDESNLILFILPAFVLCLLFTNLELRLMLMIFQARFQNINIRTVICRFNLTTYGGLLLIYPILLYSNLNAFFFLCICLLFFPQIYHNGVVSHRPNISSPYYQKFLLIRFLLILYLKAFPWNIFQLKPDYLLTFVCTSLVMFQLALVWVQNRYGPKKILPSFLLPPVYDYSCEAVANFEEGVPQEGEGECVICLLPLKQNSQQALQYAIPARLRLMRTPCNHCFHGACLVKWMQIKMECPQCRGPLPAYE